jgi:hypothetical protein
LPGVGVALDAVPLEPHALEASAANETSKVQKRDAIIVVLSFSGIHPRPRH